MGNRYYFVRDKLIATAPNTSKRVHNEMHPLLGIAFFCPVCSVVWALSVVDDQETYVEHILCDKHEPTPSRPAPGTLYLPWNEAWNEALPKEILARDFLLMFNYKRKTDDN